MLRLQLVEPSKLHQYWEYIEDGLTECLTHDQNNVWIYDVYAAIKAAQCYLYLGWAGDKYAGFFTIQLLPDAFDGELRLHLWSVHNVAGYSILEEGLGQIEAIARQANCGKITFSADRFCYERLGKKLGFNLREIILEKDVDYG